MRNGIKIDEKLVETARKAGRHRTDSAAVRAALSEYIRRHERPSILDLFGKIDFDPEYDYKALRRAKRCP